MGGWSGRSRFSEFCGDPHKLARDGEQRSHAHVYIFADAFFGTHGGSRNFTAPATESNAHMHTYTVSRMHVYNFADAFFGTHGGFRSSTATPANSPATSSAANPERQNHLFQKSQHLPLQKVQIKRVQEGGGPLRKTLLIFQRNMNPWPRLLVPSRDPWRS